MLGRLVRPVTADQRRAALEPEIPAKHNKDEEQEKYNLQKRKHTKLTTCKGDI